MAATPPDARGGRFADLGTRILSALAAAAAGAVLLYLGGFWTLLLVLAVTGAMAWEWRSITMYRGGRCGTDAAPLMAAVAGAMLVAQALSAAAALLWLVLALAVAAVADRAAGRPSAAGWAALGGAYVGAAGIGFLYLRGQEPGGFAAALWLCLVVVAADVGGYFAGRLIGGPKLWPRVSPKKTWAGSVGGILLAVAAAAAFGAAAAGTVAVRPCLLAAAVAVVSQAGDLAESALKRHFGVKDSGRLLPGHGGALDRFDGLMAAAILAAAVTAWRGQPVLDW